MRNPQPDVDIEINYDAELEEFGSDSDAADARFCRVRIKDRNIVPGSLKLEPPDPENQTSGDFLACPVQVRAKTEDYTELYDGDRTVRFRAELDLASIMLAWKTVQEAAKEPRRFLIKVQIETNLKSGPREVTRHGRVKINLNTIRWTWTPLIRDREGAPAIQNGDEQDNTPIEVDIDGTDKNGFRLEVERGVLREDGEYEAAKSDFTHYLSPDGKVDNNVIFLEPEPWDPKIQPTQQIVTTWWTKNLPPTHEVLSKLPIETSIRVQAFPEHKIKKRAPRKYLPEDIPRLAIREIPLRLGSAKWKVRLDTPNPEKAPVLIDKDLSGDNCFLVKIQILDDSHQNIRVLKKHELEWKLLPGPDGNFPGKIRSGGQTGLTQGVWVTDDDGYVEFYFCPEESNAFLFWQREGFQFFGKFEVRRKGGKPDAPHFPPADKSAEKGAPSFVLDWAPKVDLQFFKIPYFTKEKTLDPDNLPTDETVEAIELQLEEAQAEEYQNIFRTGGAVTIAPIAHGHEQTEGKRPDFPLDDYRLIVGQRSRKGAQQRKIIVVNSASPSGAKAATLQIAPSPRGKGQTPGQLTLQPEAPVHPDTKSRLDAIVKHGTELEEATAKSSDGGAKGHASYADAAANFHKLSIGFYNQAVEHFASTPQGALIEKCKPLFFTLPSMASFLHQGCATWRYLGGAINFHRQAYRRFEQAFNTFYFDVVQWKPVRDMLAKAWEKIKTAAPTLGGWAEGLFNLPNLLRKGTDKMQEAAFKWLVGTFRKPVEDALQRAKDQIKTAVDKLSELTSRRGEVAQALAAARTRFNEAVTQFSQHADDFVNAGKQMGELIRAKRTAGVPDSEIMAELQTLGLVARFETAKQGLQQARAKILDEVRGGSRSSYLGATKEAMMAETQHSYWTARQKSFEEVGKHFDEGSQALAKLEEKAAKLGEKEIDAVVKKFQDMPKDLETVVPSVSQQGQQFIDQARDEYMQSANQVLQKVRTLQPYRQMLDIKQFGPGTQVVPGAGWAGVFDDLQAFENQISQNSTAAGEFTGMVKNFFDRNLSGLQRVWQAEKMLVDQAVKDGLKKGTARGSEQLRQALDGAPGSPPSSSDSGFLDQAWNLVKSVLSWVDNLLFNLPSYAMSWVLWGLGWLARLILVPLNFIFRMMERLLATVFELLVSGYEWLQTNNEARRALSSLTVPAFDAGSTAYAGSGLGDFFNLPYDRDLDQAKRMQQGYHRFYNPASADEPADASLDEAIKKAFETGYEDYYPSQFKQGRSLLYGLSKRVLDKTMLESPPCEDDPQERVFMAWRAAETVDRGINDYLASGDHSSLSKKGFFEPFWSLMAGDTSWNTRRLEQICDWIGWTAAWGLRITACIVAFFLWWGTAITVVAVASLLESASAVSAISGMIRLALVALGFYPYSIAYPRDVMLMQGLLFATVLAPPSERFQASSETDILSKVR